MAKRLLPTLSVFRALWVATVQKTGACRRLGRALEPRTFPVLAPRPIRNMDAASCDEMLARQSVAGIVVVEKNRCIRISALDRPIVAVQPWVLRAGRDKCRDNLAFTSVPVTQSLSYT